MFELVEDRAGIPEETQKDHRLVQHLGVFRAGRTEVLQAEGLENGSQQPLDRVTEIDHVRGDDRRDGERDDDDRQDVLPDLAKCDAK